MKFFKIIMTLVFIVTVCGCISNKENSSQLLTSIVNEYQDHEGYDEQEFPLGLFTKKFYQSEADFAKTILTKLSEVSEMALSETEVISLKLLKFKLKDQIDYFTFERFLNPLLSDAGFHSNLNYSVRPLSSYKAAKNYLNKLNAIPVFVDQHFVNLREGLEKGVSQPKVIFNGYESTYEDHIMTDFSDSYFYSPFKNLPENITQDQKDSILSAAKIAIENSVIPQFKRIKTFFEDEYLPKTRISIGVSETPAGEEYYQNRINFYTTSTLYSAEDIHQIGLKEVARIKAEMRKIIKEVKFKGNFLAFLEFLRTDKQFYAKTPKELLMFARDIAKRADEQLPRFFKTLPRKPYGVAPVPDAIAPKYTGGRYVGTSKNSTNPGYYWVNTYDLPSRTLYTIPSLTVHEAVPGHHLQGALNNELGDSIPQFRRDLYLSAYGEGWGLYSEFLAEEMGMYTTPYERFGKFTYEMWRACRLVVDTGIHAKKWTRQEGIDYYNENTPAAESACVKMVERHIVMPGQATAYTIGMNKILDLRENAKKELGDKFDIKEFHDVVLTDGALPLTILESKVNSWIKSKN